jgi:hypothetical protein
MAEVFDAHAKALELENDVKTYFDSRVSTHPIENSLVRDAAGDKLRAELTELSSDQDKFDAVGKELEKTGSEFFSTLPGVLISASHGHLNELEFIPSMWDFSAREYDRYSFDKPGPRLSGGE